MAVEDIMEFYNKWYHMPIWSLLSIYPFEGKNYNHLGSMVVPHLSAREARDSVLLLERLGLIKRNRNGIFEAVDALVSAVEK